jgi:hypothetical protein
MKQALAVVCAVATLGLSGCHSAYVQASITNATASPITLVELDYPSASFGTGSLAPGATYHYRFQMIGSGDAKVIWTDAAQHEHTVKGPALHEKQEGTLAVKISGDSAEWTTHLQH